jgi:hypothetical protein
MIKSINIPFPVLDFILDDLNQNETEQTLTHEVIRAGSFNQAVEIDIKLEFEVEPISEPNYVDGCLESYQTVARVLVIENVELIAWHGGIEIHVENEKECEEYIREQLKKIVK